MATSLKEKLFAQASSFPELQALLLTGSPAPFRWYDQQLPQKTVFPCVVVRIISNPSTYAVTGRLPTSFSRVEFRIYGTGSDSQNADLVAQAVSDFLDVFNGYGIVTPHSVHANRIVGDRDGGVADTEPLTFLRMIDAQIYNNSTL